jgi:hypothetical protein
MPSLSNRNQTKSPKNSSTPPTPPPPGPPPVPAPPLVPGLIAKAAEFRQLFIANGAEHHLMGGQFAVRRALRAALIEKVWAMKADLLKRELVNLIQGQSHDIMAFALLHSEVRLSDEESKDPSNPDHKRMAGVLKLNAIVNTTKIYKETTAYARTLLDKPAVPGTPAVSGPDRALALEVLDDKTATGAWSWNTTQKWLAAPGLVPFSFDKLSLPRALALYMNATVQCAPVAGATAKKLLSTRAVAASEVAAFSGATLSSVQDSDKNKPDLVLQFSATQLGSVIPKVRHVLQGDPGGPLKSGYLVAGVLSGYTWDWKYPEFHPKIEHYILLFAAEGDQFLFWDPAVGDTNIAGLERQLGLAIGILYYDHADPAKSRLSTGIDSGDLSNLVGGDHRAFPHRHRYQIQTLAKPV